MNAKTNNDAQPPVVASPPPMIRDIYAAEIIPVGQEPRPADFPDDSSSPQASPGGLVVRRYDNNSSGRQIRNPDGFFRYKNALEEVRAFRRETMRHLRRAEICVWLAIHECHGIDGAQVSQATISKLAGIKSRRHVVEAIEYLENSGLLEVLVQGRYRPNGNGDHGLASIYRVYPRPEPRLARVPLTKNRSKKSRKKADGDENARPIVRVEKPK